LKLALALFTFAASAHSQQDTVSLDPVALVRHAVQLREQQAEAHHPLRYELRNQNAHRDTTRLIVETRDGDVARLIALDGKPLDEAANQAELDRLNNLLEHPDLQEKRHHAEIKDEQRVTHLMHQLPEAFLYHLEGSVTCGDRQCYRLTFKPNPKFQPPDTESRIFRGVAGEVWIDQASERMARIDANFIADVDFGLGLIGKVNKGGHALIEQTDIGADDFELTALKVNMTGKALVFKSLNVQINESASHYSEVPPNLDYRGAIKLLEAR
jgi:hypothetical protein